MGNSSFNTGTHKRPLNNSHCDHYCDQPAHTGDTSRDTKNRSRKWSSEPPTEERDEEEEGDEEEE